MRRALLLSGGMDSTSLAYWLRPPVAITIDYGQRAARAEIRASEAVCRSLELEHVVIHAGLAHLGSGDLAGRATLSIGSVSEWWPFRNQMLITLAGMKCVSIGVEELLIGTLKTDEIHVDGTPLFVQQIDSLMRLQEGGLRVTAPAMGLSAVELIRESAIPDEILAWAHSCHVSNYACGCCRGCEKHFLTLKELGRDPY